MVLCVSPIRTIRDGTALEYLEVTVTSAIDQTIEIYIDTDLAHSEPVSANEATRIMFSFPVPKPEGVYDLRVVGVTAGEWRGSVAITGTQYAIWFKDEEGNPVSVNATYINLDNPLLLNPKRVKEELYMTYTLADKWFLEVSTREPNGFRFAIIDLSKITEETTITLPKITEAMVAYKIDLGLMWGAIVRGASAIDYITGTVASAIGFEGRPSFVTYIIQYLFNVLPYPPYAWKLEGNILTVYHKVTREMIGVVPAIIALISLAIKLATLVAVVGFISWAVVTFAEADKARFEAQKAIPEEHRKAEEAWLEYAREKGLTPQETLRGLETISSAYTQMSKNIEPTPAEVITRTVVPFAVLGTIAVIIIAIIWYITRGRS